MSCLDDEIEEAIKEGKLTKCPPGKAAGSEMLTDWALRRSAGQSSVNEKSPKYKMNKKCLKAKKKKKKIPWSVRKKDPDRLKRLREKREKRAKLKEKQRRRAHREREETGRTERRDFSDMNVYDMSISPWEEQTVVESTAEQIVSDIMRHG